MGQNCVHRSEVGIMVVIPGLAGTQYKVRIRLRAPGWVVVDGETGRARGKEIPSFTTTLSCMRRKQRA